MPEYVTRDEFEARVGVLEQEVDGEKLVTRHILEQTRRNGDDIAAMKTQLSRVETRLDGVETQIGSLSGDLKGLIKNLPGMMRDVMREVLGERDRKK
jgi:hypothetical protein